MLDCKVPSCRDQIADAPSVQDHLCGECEDHFFGVQEGLQQLGVQYRLNKFMVRGLDYYCRTTFEFLTGDLGAQAAVAAGGRYDGLVELLGGPKNSPGIGFAMGMERLVLLLQQQQGADTSKGVELFVAGIGETASRVGFGLAHSLRKERVSVAMDHEGRSLKSQMKQAGKAGAHFVLIIGETELEAGRGILRNMETKKEREIALSASAVVAALNI